MIAQVGMALEVSTEWGHCLGLVIMENRWRLLLRWRGKGMDRMWLGWLWIHIWSEAGLGDRC